MEFVVLPARLEFIACDEIRFPRGHETNVFRGALGSHLRRIACNPECRSARTCPRRGSCAYARFFEPRWEQGPSGYWDAPRPFVLRWVAPAGSTRSGGVFSLDLFLFDIVAPCWEYLAQAFERAGKGGLGVGRGRAKLGKFEIGVFEKREGDTTNLHSRGSGRAEASHLIQRVNGSGILRLPVAGRDRPGSVRLRFVTPTELKVNGTVFDQPDFSILTRRLAERVWALGRLYQGWPGEWRCRDLLDLGRLVRLKSWEWARSKTERRSSRTGQRHSIGGFTGWAEYEGPIGAFLPLLEIARWTGVGRQTVWGKGEVHVEAVGWSAEPKGVFADSRAGDANW